MTATLTLDLHEVIELAATLSVFLDQQETRTDLLRGVELKIKQQVEQQFTEDQMMDAIKDLEIQSLIGRTA